jgi:hypothetical protein
MHSCLLGTHGVWNIIPSLSSNINMSSTISKQRNMLDAVVGPVWESSSFSSFEENHS